MDELSRCLKFEQAAFVLFKHVPVWNLNSAIKNMLVVTHENALFMVKGLLVLKNAFLIAILDNVTFRRSIT